MEWVFAELTQITGQTVQAMLGMTLPDYVATMTDKVCSQVPPVGAFYLVESGSHIVGMGGLRSNAVGVVEVKRIYVRPSYRGQQLGHQLLQRLLDDAKAFGYQRVVLDSAPFMQAAHRVYEDFGFSARGPYENTEVPPELHAVWRFMELTL
ncbi:MAG: hypothetical protein CFE43_09950 [Burkholderiales bacterium PBB3]|nr:MAG: hypothetical protein CFE43_09950 [Burkholderiales bacterium PBB3]